MDFSFLPNYWAYFNQGILVTILVSVLVVFFGVLIGILVALIKYSRLKGLDALVSFYVWIFRGTPMVVQIMIAFSWMHFHQLPIVPFGVLDLDFTRLVPGMIILSLNSGAYISETIRSGLEAVPKGQLEAAYSLGLSPIHTVRYILMPQAIKTSLPALGNELITIIKDSSLLQTIGVMELWNGAQTVVTATYLPIEPLVLAALYYLLLTTVLAFLLKQMETYLLKGRMY